MSGSGRVRVLSCAWLTLLGCLAVAPAAPGAREARISVPVASVYRAPAPGAERVTQGLLWERVLVLGERGPWVKVLLPDQYRTPQGYPGWMLRRHLVLDTPETLAPVVTVGVPQAAVRLRPEAGSPVASVALFSSDLPWSRRQGDWFQVKLPGRAEPGWVSAREVLEAPLPAQGADVLATASRLEGTSYLWGGMSRQGIDCSGLAYTVYKVHGFLLPRDADQQFQVGVAVDRADLEPGDLVFFGSAKTGRVTHVGFFVGEDQFLHASGTWGVARTSLEHPRYKTAWLGARRILTEPAP